MCAGITRVALKAFVELVRLQTLSRQGLQQLQVDVHFLRPQLRRYGLLCCSRGLTLDTSLLCQSAGMARVSAGWHSITRFMCFCNMSSRCC